MKSVEDLDVFKLAHSERSELTDDQGPFQAERRLVSWNRCGRRNGLNGAERYERLERLEPACQCSPFDLLKA